MSPIPTDTGPKFKPNFVTPLSNRIDRGLAMDTNGIELPQTHGLGGGNEIVYEGKIFYMGIIDILQQFNVRKRLEAKFRRMTGSGWRDASCVHPNLYADRFMEFFDEYSTRTPGAKDAEEIEADDVDQNLYDDDDLENVEEVLFDDEKGEGSNDYLFSADD